MVFCCHVYVCVYDETFTIFWYFIIWYIRWKESCPSASLSTDLWRCVGKWRYNSWLLNLRARWGCIVLGENKCISFQCGYMQVINLFICVTLYFIFTFCYSFYNFLFLFINLFQSCLHSCESAYVLRQSTGKGNYTVASRLFSLNNLEWHWYYFYVKYLNVHDVVSSLHSF